MRRLSWNKWYLVLFLFIANVFSWYVLAYEVPKDILTVSFFDVGQGDAVFIETPSGNQVLIDGGPPNKQVLRELRKAMSFYDRYIDLVIATHPDQDHIGGLSDVLSRYTIGGIIESGAVNDTRAYELKEKILSEKNIPQYLGRRGVRVVLDTDTFLTILFPDRDVHSLDTNDASIIAKLTFGTQDFLFTGDASQKIERYVATLDTEFLDVEVLKAGHHGSKTATSDAFLGYTSPDYVVVSVGARNRYGHPHSEVVGRIENLSSTLLRTDELGTITFETDGRTLSVR